MAFMRSGVRSPSAPPFNRSASVQGGLQGDAAGRTQVVAARGARPARGRCGRRVREPARPDRQERQDPGALLRRLHGHLGPLGLRPGVRRHASSAWTTTTSSATALSFHDKPHNVVIEFWTQQDDAAAEDAPSQVARTSLLFSKIDQILELGRRHPDPGRGLLRRPVRAPASTMTATDGVKGFVSCASSRRRSSRGRSWTSPSRTSSSTSARPRRTCPTPSARSADEALGGRPGGLCRFSGARAPRRPPARNASISRRTSSGSSSRTTRRRNSWAPARPRAYQIRCRRMVCTPWRGPHSSIESARWRAMTRPSSRRRSAAAAGCRRAARPPPGRSTGCRRRRARS